MLYGYPEDVAIEENWLHESLCEMIQSIHGCLQAEEEPVAWPDIIPEQHRDALCRRTSLRDRLSAYTRALGRLSSANRARVLNALNDQNKIRLLLSCECECEAVSDLPKSIRKPIIDLFSSAFELLTPLGIRDKYYSKIYELSNDHVCPFCGCERFDAPSGPREDLDHYLSKNRYPFAAANLRNLVPMGHKCNSKYKLAQDILRKDGGTRRKSIDPYNYTGTKIRLNNSTPFAGEDGRKPLWQIEFEPNTEEIETWESVFHIRERYKNNELDESFDSWLRKFSRLWQCSTCQSDLELVQVIERHISFLEGEGLKDRAFLELAVFQMLHAHCRQGNQRLLNMFRDLVSGIVTLTC